MIFRRFCFCLTIILVVNRIRFKAPCQITFFVILLRIGQSAFTLNKTTKANT